jgi:ABC-type polysaccharide/polyol phosphate export permease
MIIETINNISQLLGIPLSVIPNIITLFVTIIILFVSMKSELSWSALAVLYAVFMAILSLLGIESVFNLVSLIVNALSDVLEILFMRYPL